MLVEALDRGVAKRSGSGQIPEVQRFMLVEALDGWPRGLGVA